MRQLMMDDELEGLYDRLTLQDLFVNVIPKYNFRGIPLIYGTAGEFEAPESNLFYYELEKQKMRTEDESG